MEKQVPHRAFRPIRNDIGLACRPVRNGVDFCFQPWFSLVFRGRSFVSSLVLNGEAYFIIHPLSAFCYPPSASLRRSSAAKVELRSTGQPGAAVPT
jgi:hypothetical protein